MSDFQYLKNDWAIARCEARLLEPDEDDPQCPCKYNDDCLGDVCDCLCHAALGATIDEGDRRYQEFKEGLW